MKKYTYYLVIQQNWGNGWDDVDFHEANSKGIPLDADLFLKNKKAYRDNQTAPLRTIFRKELNKQK